MKFEQQRNKRVTIDFPDNLYRLMKSFTAFKDYSVKDFVINAVSKELQDNNINVAIPNDKTLEVFAKTDKGEDLKEYSDFNKFLSDINR